MKKVILVFLLLGFLIIQILGCLGEKGGESFIGTDAQDPNSIVPPAGATSKNEIGTNGGEASLGNFSIDFPANSLSDNTNVTVTSLGSNVSFDTNGTLVGSAIKVSYSKSSNIAPKGKNLSKTTISPRITFSVSNGDSIVILKKGTAEGNGEILSNIEYPAFPFIEDSTESQTKITMIDNLSYLFVGDTTYAAIELSPQRIIDPTLICFQISTRVPYPDSPHTPLGSKIPIILVHGWDENDNAFMFGENEPWLSTYKEQIWNTFYDELRNTTLDKLESNVQIYEFIYPTYKNIADNGHKLAEFLSNIDSLNTNKNVFIIAHSMGGLVARHALEHEIKGTKIGNIVNKIVTLGTPHHGSILASFKYFIDRYDLSFKDTMDGLFLLKYYSILFKADTAGFKDLCWDNFDGAISPSIEKKGMIVNFDLFSFNTANIYDSRIVSFVGMCDPAYARFMLSDVHRTGAALMLSKYIIDLWEGKTYFSDGAVPSESAWFEDHDTEIGLFLNHDHGDLYNEADVIQEVLDCINHHADFGPVNNPPEITLTSPTGGETWSGTQDITWNASDEDDDTLRINIFYSLDSGISWTSITTDETNDGTYTWDTITVDPGNNYRIKIEVEDDQDTNEDVSKSDFAITDIKTLSSITLNPDSKNLTTSNVGGSLSEVDVTAHYSDGDTNNVKYVCNWEMISGPGSYDPVEKYYTVAGAGTAIIRCSYTSGEVTQTADYIITITESENQAPTVSITGGPTGTTTDNTPTFSYSGTDTDGTVAGYYVDIDDSTPDIWVIDTSYTLSTLADGNYTFYVQAKDNDGALSDIESRSFTVGTSEDELDVIATYNSPHSYPTGLTWDGAYLWNADNGTGKIYKLNPSDCSIVATFNPPGSSPTGLTWDGTYLWNADIDTDAIYKLNPSDCSVIATYNSPHSIPTGLTWDGSNLWNTDFWSEKIYKLNPSDCSVIATYNSPGVYSNGLAWDGIYLWYADGDSDKIYKLNPSDCSIVATYNSPGPAPIGLTWDGTYLWNIDSDTDLIYKILP